MFHSIPDQTWAQTWAQNIGAVMAKQINSLKSIQLSKAKPGKLNDGGGLYLITKVTGRSQWKLFYPYRSKRREMGLGGFPTTSLSDARTQAVRWRSVLSQGLDPIVERDKEREILNYRETLSEVFVKAFEAKKRALVDGGKAGRWDSPLRLHIMPHIGELPIEDINSKHIERVLKPIWNEKEETARKCLERLSYVIRYALAGNLKVDVSAVENARALLGVQDDISINIPSLPWQEVPKFYKSLRDDIMSNLALRFLILTCLRTNAICHANINWIDGDVMTVPAEYMKGEKFTKKPFRVPLSHEALKVINLCPVDHMGVIFRGLGTQYMSDSSMSKFMRENGHKGRATPHGFRASLRDWISDCTETSHEVTEIVLAHKVGDKVENAYKRTDHLEKRRVLSEQWSKFVVDVIS